MSPLNGTCISVWGIKWEDGRGKVMRKLPLMLGKVSIAMYNPHPLPHLPQVGGVVLAIDRRIKPIVDESVGWMLSVAHNGHIICYTSIAT